MKTLAGQELRYGDYKEILARVDALLWALVYQPVVDLVRPTLPRRLRAEVAAGVLRDATAAELRNAPEDALRKALRDGAVQIVPDPTGEYALFVVAKPDRRVSDGLRAFGASVDKRTGVWRCLPAQVPAWVRLEAEGYGVKARAAHDAVLKALDDIQGRVDHAIDEASLARAADHAIGEVASGWKETAKGMQVTPDLGPAGQAALAAGFARSRGIQITSPGTKVGLVDALEFSTKREVKVWAQEALDRLREQVDENAAQGYRAEGLADRIRNEYGVSKGRADLIARQETNNFMANYRAARAADAGLKRYQWFCVRDAKTRKDHLALHGQIFRYDTPPVTDTRTGARNNPGQDFRCRCNDRPMIE